MKPTSELEKDFRSDDSQWYRYNYEINIRTSKGFRFDDEEMERDRITLLIVHKYQWKRTIVV
jgi:hypothetical protein